MVVESCKAVPANKIDDNTPDLSLLRSSTSSISRRAYRISFFLTDGDDVLDTPDNAGENASLGDVSETSNTAARAESATLMTS